MPEERVHRTLAAVLTADVVGHSHLTEQNDTARKMSVRIWPRCLEIQTWLMNWYLWRDISAFYKMRAENTIRRVTT